jgi:hypothetical protein
MSHSPLLELFPANFLNESTIRHGLGEEFHLCENGHMVFHWTDFHETCDVIKERLENEPGLNLELQKKLAALERLSQVPVWIRSKVKVHQTTMYELYHQYILNQTKLARDIDPFGPMAISFISSTGPFRELAITECFNQMIYKDFVMMFLLQNKLPKRDYRIRIKAKVLMEYGADYNQAALINLEQLTMQGLLLSIDSSFFLKEMSHQDELRFFIDTSVLANSCDKTLPELKEYLNQHALNLLYSSNKKDAMTCKVSDLSVQSSFDFLKNNKVFIFISYQKMNSSENSISGITSFINHTRELMRDYYQIDKSKKSA